MNEDNGTVELPKGKIVAGSWHVVKKLGEGGCGSVYLVRSLEDQSEAAMKAESNFSSGGCVLKLEVAILKKLKGKPHVCQLMCAARATTYSYIVMTLLGESLNRIVKKLGRAITVSTQTRIAGNVLFCLKQIHDIGFIHRDLKPANMALGRKGTSEARFFAVLDFGLARQYVVPHDEAGKLLMRRPRDRALFRGTTRYCSIRMHDRSEQGRVDDLWSMLYLLAELRGPLPWASQNNKRIVGELKRLHPDSEVLQNSPTQFLAIATYLRTLTYFHRPDYYKIYQLLINVMEKGRFSWNDPFDWETIEPAGSPIQPKLIRSQAIGLDKTFEKKMSREVVKTPERSNMSKEIVRTPERSNMSKEVVRTPERSNMSKEVVGTPERSNMSKEVVRTPEKSNMSKENVKAPEGKSKETVSKSREATNMSKEKMGSKEVVGDDDNDGGSLSSKRKNEMMRLMPFDPEFFTTDPIGF